MRENPYLNQIRSIYKSLLAAQMPEVADEADILIIASAKENILKTLDNVIEGKAEPYLIEKEIKNIYNLNVAKARKKNITLHFNTNEPVKLPDPIATHEGTLVQSGSLLIDSTLITRAIETFLENSIEFIRPDGVSPDHDPRNIHLIIRDISGAGVDPSSDRTIEFIFYDDGIGMPERKRNELNGLKETEVKYIADSPASAPPRTVSTTASPAFTGRSTSTLLVPPQSPVSPLSLPSPATPMRASGGGWGKGTETVVNAIKNLPEYQYKFYSSTTGKTYSACTFSFNCKVDALSQTKEVESQHSKDSLIDIMHHIKARATSIITALKPILKSTAEPSLTSYINNVITQCNIIFTLANEYYTSLGPVTDKLFTVDCETKEATKKQSKTLVEKNSPLRILVLDDDTTSKKSTILKLQNAFSKKVEIIYAHSAEEARDCLKDTKKPIHIALFDENLDVHGGTKGSELARSLYSPESGVSHIPLIIGMSGDGSPDYYTTAIQAGMVGFIAKPIEVLALCNMLIAKQALWQAVQVQTRHLEPQSQEASLTPDLGSYAAMVLQQQAQVREQH